MSRDAHRLALVGAHQIGFDGADEAEIEARTIGMLSRALNIKKVLAFVGSGVSGAYGFPLWHQFASRGVELTLEPSHKLRVTQAERLVLTRYLRDAEKRVSRSSARVASTLAWEDRTLLVLGLCEELFLRQGLKIEFRSKMAELIRRGSQPVSSDPLAAVMHHLSIRRFLTTNYDTAIEDAASRVLGASCQHRPVAPHSFANPGIAVHHLGPAFQSLRFDPSRHHDLIQFAISAPGFEYGVFHLHGVSSVAESMVVTERDYQRVYLRDDPEHRAYRDALDLTLSANAILFLGLGMQEADLLRPLRQLVAERHRDARERPFFALLPRPKNGATRIEWRRYLHTRFGVKAIFYPVVGDHTESFCRAIEGLSCDWRKWWREWQEKPVLRRPIFHSVNERVRVHHYTEIHDELFDQRSIDDVVARLEQDRVLAVLGSAGTGKGGLGIRLMRDRTVLGRFQKCFFATAHFTNELLSTLEAAANFFDGDATPEKQSPLERIRSSLTANENLIVIGGIERLVSELRFDESDSDEPPGEAGYPLPVGKAINREVSDLFAVAVSLSMDENCKGRMVLTSSIWPEELRNVPRIALRGVDISKLTQTGPFVGLDEKLVRTLHYTLRGHVYALSVAQQALKHSHKLDRATWLQNLIASLSAVDLPRRAELTIAAAIQLVAVTPQLLDVLHRVSQFTTPVTAETICATYPPDDSTSCQVDDALTELAKRDLLIRINDARFTAHTVVRTYVLHLLGSAPDCPGEPQRFDTPGFSTPASEVSALTERGHELTIGGVDGLLSAAIRHRSPKKRKECLRAAFGLLRSRWVATELGRLAGFEQERVLDLPRSHYQAHQARLARLLNAVRSAGRRWDRYTAPELPSALTGHVDTAIPPTHEGRKNTDRSPVGNDSQRDWPEDETGILYADELAWLYNELALVAFCQGSPHDAYSLLRMRQDVNDFSERNELGIRWLQTELALAQVQIERARLPRARYHLDSVLRLGLQLRDDDIVAQARGYAGLVYHLAGDYEKADELYTIAIRTLGKTLNRRGASIFLRHRGDLRRSLRRYEEARNDIAASIAVAEAGRHRDLVHFSRIAEAHVEVVSDLGRNSPSLETLQPAIEFARIVGIPKLEAETYKVQGHIALIQGEIELAGRLASRCLGIVSGLGMHLRITSTVVLMGDVARRKGHFRAAEHLYRCGISLAQRQGYQSQVEGAERALMVVQRDGSDSVDSQEN